MNFLVLQLTDSVSALTDTLQAKPLVDSTLYLELKSGMKDAAKTSNNLWMIIATLLLFLMVIGFTCLETGLTRSKNAANVLFKYILIPAIALLTFVGWGYGIIFYQSFSLFDQDMLFIKSVSESGISGTLFFFYQLFLLIISTCIISGAVAERIRIPSFILYCVLFAGLIYPSTGILYWKWFHTFMAPGFHDFSGAAIIHTVGGGAALAAAAMIGPRIGKYSEGRIMPIMGHTIPVAGLGVFFLWLGWFGFTGGAVYSSDPARLSFVIATTFISSIGGCVGAFLISYFIYRTHDITMIMNGILAGLVAISASADIMSPLEAFIIGVIAGLLVVFSVLLFDKLKIDDPVGAVSVHMVCGIWGTLAVGIFGPLASKEQFVSQILGSISLVIVVLVFSFLVLFLIRKTIGLRIPYKDELEGLDINNHGMKAYNVDAENN